MRKIVIDIYGADAGALVVVNGVIKAIKEGIDFFPVMVGEKALIDGLMAENGIENPAEVKTFNRLGYIFRDDLSSETECIFERRK